MPAPLGWTPLGCSTLKHCPPGFLLLRTPCLDAGSMQKRASTFGINACLQSAKLVWWDCPLYTSGSSHSATLVQASSCPPGRTVGASKQSLHPHSPASACLLSKWQECVPALSSNPPGASIAPEIASRLQPRVFKVLLSSHPWSLPPKLFVLWIPGI